jgi:hypothetical protein
MTPPVGESALLSAEQWASRVEAVQDGGEPALYVTAEDFANLRRALDEAERREQHFCLAQPVYTPPSWGAAVALVGFPIVVDAEKAAEQTARLGSEVRS